MNNSVDMINKKERKDWPSGFESVGQKEYHQYQRIISTIQKITALYGYEQLQTPRVVDLSWVTHKNTGSTEIKNEMFALGRAGQSEVGSMVLVFEHTLSLAKYLAFQGQRVNYPFRRIEVGSVYRGERAQKGRKKEFLQADVDVVGLQAPWGEVEVISMMAEMINSLSFPPETKIHLNDRKILSSLIDSIDDVTDPDEIKSIMRQIDKLDKESPEKIIDECNYKGIPTKSIIEILKMNNTLKEIEDPVQSIASFSEMLKENNWSNVDIETALVNMVDSVNLLGKLKNRTYFDLCLTRGLDYYTGTVFEIHDPRIGHSLCGGGRYDNLIQDMGGPENMAAIGFSFGIDRMVLAMEHLGINADDDKNLRVAVLAFGDGNQEYTLGVAAKIRDMGVSAVALNPSSHKIKNLLKQASEAGYQYCVIIGEDEVKNQTVSLKNMKTREQVTIPLDLLDQKIEDISKENK